MLIIFIKWEIYAEIVGDNDFIDAQTERRIEVPSERRTSATMRKNTEPSFRKEPDVSVRQFPPSAGGVNRGSWKRR